MLKKIADKFSTTLYVQIWEKRIRVLDINSGEVFDEKPLVQIDTNKDGSKKVIAVGNQVYQNGVNPFSHPRSLLNDFYIAESLLQFIVKKLVGKKLLAASPVMIIHPMEKTEGGLTLIEERAFLEMAMGAGARQVAFYQGDKALEPQEINFQEIAAQNKL